MAAKAATKEKKIAPPPTKEFLAECRSKVNIALMSSIKFLFDDDANGGDFYAHIMMSMDRIIDDPRIPTAAVSVSNKINLYINSYFFVHELANGLDPKSESDKKKLVARRAAVIKHEILHTIFHHLSRGKDFGNKMLANIAADLVVNSNIDKDLLGKIGLFPENFKLPKDQTLQWYYENYPIEDNPICQDPNGHDKQHQQKQKAQGQGQQSKEEKGEGKEKGDGKGEGKEKEDGKGQGKGKGEKGEKGQGGGQGDPSQDHEHGEGGEPCDHEGCDHNHDQQDQQDSSGGHAVDGNGNCTECNGKRTMDNHGVWDSDGGEHISDSMKEGLVNDALRSASDATKNAGRLPKSIQDMIALAKKKPQIPWQMLLKQFVSKLSNGQLKHTKKRISKRFKSRPGIKIKPKLKFAVCVDVSGSISDREYTIFLNEIFAIARHSGEVDVIEWDTKVQGQYKITGYKPNITRHGQGGTDPTEAIHWVNDRKQQYDGCIWFTDGHLYIDELKLPLRIPSLWVITADGSTEAVKNYRKIKLPKAESDAA
jgi:predicted metal-dependent peptidase